MKVDLDFTEMLYINNSLSSYLLEFGGYEVSKMMKKDINKILIKINSCIDLNKKRLQ